MLNNQMVYNPGFTMVTQANWRMWIDRIHLIKGNDMGSIRNHYPEIDAYRILLTYTLYVYIHIYYTP